jgi:ElaB/YqjD/DUF883 family membrane-anchored ribosome-binding protein
MSSKKSTLAKKTLTPLGERIEKVLTDLGVSATSFAKKIRITDAYLSKLRHKLGAGGDKFWQGIRREFPQYETYLRGETDRLTIKAGGAVDIHHAMESGPNQLRLPEFDKYRVVQMIGSENEEIKSINTKLDKILDLVLRHDREIDELKRREKDRQGGGHEKNGVSCSDGVARRS